MKRAIRLTADGRLSARMYDLEDGSTDSLSISSSAVQRLKADGSTFIESNLKESSISIKALKRLLEKSKSRN